MVSLVETAVARRNGGQTAEDGACETRGVSEQDSNLDTLDVWLGLPR